jgi:poly(hydroxyalkanoate) depolymerase family esterase
LVYLQITLLGGGKFISSLRFFIMIKIYKNVLNLLLLFCSLICTAQKDLQQITHFGNNPGNLVLYMHVPKITTKKMALVVALHGCNQDPAIISKQSGWNKLADENSFYVIYPRQKFLNNPSSCFNWYSESDISKNSGESGSIKQMIDFVCDSFSIDKSKIFAYGLSAGAAMTAALLADYPETFNAGAILAGGPFMMATNPLSGVSAMVNPKHKSSKEWGELVLNQNPDYKNNYPRVVIIHGKDDNVVDFENSNQLVKQWAYVLHTDTFPSKIIGDFANNKNVEKKIYLNANQAEKIIFYEVTGLGHALPVDPGDAPYKGGKTGLFAVDIDFFSTYWIAKDFGILK